jgi:hypothetical protein
MIEPTVLQGLFETAWHPYRNAHLLVPKYKEKYCFIIFAGSANRHTLKDGGIPHIVQESSEDYPGLPISLLMTFHSGYTQKILHKDIRDYMAFRTTHGMYRPTRLVQGATNLVSAFD